MSRPLNWGILGTSFISGVMADAIIKEGNSRLYAAAGRSAATLDSFCQAYPGIIRYQDYDALIADPQVDIIYIALPNHLHHQYVVKAAQAGKAILCEKSLSIDMAKTELALAAVRQHQVFFLEGLMYLTHPLAKALSDVIQAGTLGEIRSITGRYCAAIAQFVNPDSMGCIYNLGCYPASLMHLLLQQAFGDEIFADYRITGHGRRGADGNICETSAVLQFANGTLAHLHSAEDYGMDWAFSVQGTRGSLNLLSNPWLPEATGNRFPSIYCECNSTHRMFIRNSQSHLRSV